MGLLEKDLTLMLAYALRAECEREGFHVLLTRESDQDPSFDERAGIANSHHNAIFISLHVSSTGSPGTVRTYVYPAVTAEQSAAANAQDNSSASSGSYSEHNPPGQGLPEWDRAQQPFVADSRKLGDLIQVELSQKFSQSPELSTAVRVRDLRSVTVPAVAVEISSVDMPDAQSLRQMIPGVAASIARGISGFGRGSAGADVK
jgi:N-acetylmuramoyl-L-alanine amidase